MSTLMPNNNQPKPNHKLIAARKAENLLQRELAKRIGVNLKTVQRWEAGLAFPQEYWLNKLCEIPRKTKEDLGFGENNETLEPVNVVPPMPSSPSGNREDADNQ